MKTPASLRSDLADTFLRNGWRSSPGTGGYLPPEQLDTFTGMRTRCSERTIEMFCCSNCFLSPTLREYIEETGEEGECDFCGEAETKCVNVVDLYDMFEPLLGLYREVEWGRDYYEKFRPSGDPLPFLIEDDWGQVFSDSFDEDLKEDFMEELFKGRGLDKDFVPYDRASFWTSAMAFDPYSLWDALAEHLRYERRYIVEPNRFKDFLAVMPLVLESVTKTIPKGRNFFRSRIGPDDAEETRNPFPCEQMGQPPRDKATSGRANPLWIPFLYLATDTKTALAEVRPWKGAFVSVATFKAQEDVSVIDLTGDFTLDDPFKYGEDLSSFVFDSGLLRRLSTQLCKPIDPRRSEIEYIPSQFLTEFIRNEGYQAIFYPSAMADGKNLVLFDERLASCEEVKLYTVKGIPYEYHEL